MYSPICRTRQKRDREKYGASVRAKPRTDASRRRWRPAASLRSAWVLKRAGLEQSLRTPGEVSSSFWFRSALFGFTRLVSVLFL
jgi:hypothetical protein